MSNSEIVARVDGVCGELALRRAGEHFEVIANGTFLMDTRDGTSERLLATAAAERMPRGAPVLVGGLGVGFSLRAALDYQPAAGEVVVVEREPAVIAWNRADLAGVHAHALADPRARVVRADLRAYLRSAGRFGAICVDVDNGPQWTVDAGNAPLYTGAGLDLMRGHLLDGGVLAVWSAAAAPEFAAALRGRFGTVEELAVPVPRGEPDVVYLAR